MTKRKILYEAANFLCMFRIIIAITMAIMPRHYWFVAVLCSLALISDVLDGYCYRKFTKQHPYGHWFNRLPITLDPIADFCFVVGGIVYSKGHNVSVYAILAILLVAVITLNVGAQACSDLIWSIIMTSFTYLWFALMIATLIAVWYVSVPITWFAGVIVTMIFFYALWAKTRVKSRTIRKKGVK